MAVYITLSTRVRLPLCVSDRSWLIYHPIATFMFWFPDVWLMLAYNCFFMYWRDLLGR
jgi:hypothetical protein